MNFLVNTYRKYHIKRFFLFIVGLFCYAIGFNLFLLPNSIVFGGVSGASIVFQEVFNWSPSLFILVANVFLIFVSFVFLGKRTTMASILGAIALPIIISLTSEIGEYIDIDSNNLLLAVVFGGALCGMGIGLIYKTGFTTGGTDVINQIIYKYMHLSMGKAMVITDGVIITSGAFVFGITKAMYAIVVLYIISTLADKVLLGISDSKAFYIITNRDDEVRDYVIKVLNHTVTIFNVKSGFKGRDEQVIFCVIPTKEYFKLREGIYSIDKEAFFVVTDAYEVYGGE